MRAAMMNGFHQCGQARIIRKHFSYLDLMNDKQCSLSVQGRLECRHATPRVYFLFLCCCFSVLCFLLPCLLLSTLSCLLHSSHPFPLLLLYAVGASLCAFSSSWRKPAVNALITSKNICWKHTLVALMSDVPVSFDTYNYQKNSLCTSETWCLLKNSWSSLFCALHFSPPHRPG